MINFNHLDFTLIFTNLSSNINIHLLYYLNKFSKTFSTIRFIDIDKLKAYWLKKFNVKCIQ